MCALENAVGYVESQIQNILLVVTEWVQFFQQFLNWIQLFTRGIDMATDLLINMDDILKVFYTDEIETHALAGVHFSLKQGEYVAISGPSGWLQSLTPPIGTKSELPEKSL